jgi:polyhydroxyalkanoate synthesis regulator phasin
MAGFDPDKYLAEKAQPQAAGFDPDKYLSEKAPASEPPADGIFGPGGAVPRYLAESPNARALVEGTLDQLPIAGAIAGGIIGGGPTPTGLLGAGLGGGMGKSVQQPLEHAILGRARTAEEQIIEPIKAAGESAVYQSFGEALPYALKGASTAAGWAGKKAMSTILGPSTEVITARFARPEQIRSAKSVEQIKDILDETMGGLFKAVDEGKLAKEEAKDALKAVEHEIRAASQEGAFQFRIKQADINDQLKEAQRLLERSLAVEKEKLTSIKSPIQIADDVQTAIQDLKSQVGQGSKESYKILDQDTQAYGVRGAGKVLRQMADDMDIKPYTSANQTPGSSTALASRVNFGAPEGQASRPVTSQSIGVQNELRSFANLLEQTPEKVPARELKKILQQLDNSERAMYGQPGFDSRVSAAYKLVRGTIDDAIKIQNPEYRAKMAEVAPKTGLLSEALERFNDPRATVSKLNSIASRTAGADQELLERLGQATGRNFRAPIDQYVEAQAILKDPNKLKEIERSLPEWKQVRMQQMAKSEAARPEALPEYVKNTVASRGLPAKEQQAKSALDQAIEKFTKAESELEPFKSFSQGGTQNAVQGLMKPPSKENIELRRKMIELGTRSGKDFLQMIDDRRIASAFEGEFQRGSRNVNLGGAIGGGIGSLLMGWPGAIAGGSIGVSTGAIVDKFGPKIAGKIIDGITHVTGPIGAKQIQALDVPNDVKSYLLKFISQGQAIERGQAPPMLRKSSDQNELDRDSATPAIQDGAKRGPDKWMRDGREKLERHAPGVQLDMKDPRTREILIAASDLKPGSKAMDRLVRKLAADQMLSGSKFDMERFLHGSYSDTGRTASSPGEKLDSYFGAPTRTAIREAQKGNFSGALPKAWDQFNRDPNSAPSGKEIAKAAGVENETLQTLAGLGIEFGADPSNLMTGAGKALAKALPMAGKIEKVGKGSKAAQQILEKIDTPEKAIALTGRDRQAYLKALDEVYGERVKRAAEMGFGEEVFHGTKYTDSPIDEFRQSGTKKGDVAKYGKGVYLTNKPMFANEFADESGAVYPLLRKTPQKTFMPEDAEAARKIIEAAGKEVPSARVLRAGEEGMHLLEKAFGKDWQEPLRSQGYRLEFHQDYARNPTKIYSDAPNDIRSISAAFDPRFKDSAKLLAGQLGGDISKLKGAEKWAAQGLSKLEKHTGEEIDRDLLNDPKAKELLIQASDLKPGSKAMDAIMKKLEKRGRN